MTENALPEGPDPFWSVRVARVTFLGRQRWTFEFFSDYALLKSRNGRRVVRFPDPGSGVSHQFSSRFLRGFNFEVTTPDGTLKFDVPPEGIGELTRLAEQEPEDAAAAVPAAPADPADEPRVMAALILDEGGEPEGSARAPAGHTGEPAVIEPLVLDDITAPDGAPAPDGAAGEPAVAEEPAADDSAARRAAMQKDLKGWCVALIIIGVVSIALSGFLDPVWGGVLIAAGIAGFLIRHRGMFIVYGVVLMLAAMMNIITGRPGWVVFGILQAWWSVQEFRKFSKYAGVGDERDSASGTTPPAGYGPGANDAE